MPAVGMIADVEVVAELEEKMKDQENYGQYPRN